MSPEDKHYFYDMVATVAEKLKHRHDGSLIRQHFSDTRLKEVENNITQSDAQDLEWAYWQPFFLFHRDASDAEIDALDDDLRLVSDRTPQGKSQVCKFLVDKRETSSPWTSGLFEVFAKAALLKSDVLSVDALDCGLLNGRIIDAKVKIGKRTVGIEMSTLGESNQSEQRWEKHCKEISKDKSKLFYDCQDAYTQGRRLFDKVYEKIAPKFNQTKSQLLPKLPNLLLISFSPVISDLTSNSPSIGWALDELFASQPNGNTSEAISLQVFLQRKLTADSTSLKELLAAPRQVSGILLFNGCKLGHTRINYNAAAECRISHDEMSVIERVLAQPPPYFPC